MLPSLAMGIYMGFASGMWQLAFMSFASATIALLVSRAKSRPAVAPSISLHPETQRLLADSRVVTFWRWWFSPRVRRATSSEVARLRQQRANVRAARRVFSNIGVPPPGSHTTALLGIRDLEPVNFEISDAPHIFIVGPTGCGKSQLMLLMMRSLIARYSQQQLELALIDYKGGSLGRLLSRDTRLWLTATDLDPGDWWLRLDSQLLARERLLQSQRAVDYRAGSLLPLVVFVDELGEVVRNPQAAKTLSAIGARGRSMGMFLVAANQGLAGVPRELLLNLRLRIAVAGIDQVELVQLGARASPLINGQPSMVAARAIRQGHPELDFEFAIATDDVSGYSRADSIETDSNPWAEPTASLVKNPS